MTHLSVDSYSKVRGAQWIAGISLWTRTRPHPLNDLSEEVKYMAYFCLVGVHYMCELLMCVCVVYTDKVCIWPKVCGQGWFLLLVCSCFSWFEPGPFHFNEINLYTSVLFSCLAKAFFLVQHDCGGLCQLHKWMVFPVYCGRTWLGGTKLSSQPHPAPSGWTGTPAVSQTWSASISAGPR